MKEIVLTFGALYGGLAVIFGAFGAHALKKRMSEDLLKSFETGVKYQMYHALALLLAGLLLPFENTMQNAVGWCFIIGIFLFSFSIYGLCITTMNGNKWRFLGPVTPLGGLLLVAGWLLLMLSV
ncbi:DUF423 domain-containing protein [Flavobacterium suncheonense]|uniref:Membrane protein n=1 Tax=Flavobacterium suncheonense GH29-5 = DSM 17707 TaxID=1121899 RepID=A0A0A2M6K0_9FLAO|nr:DUF423 domain-containing protein [Flavobacterium suncheonense]KGO87914.1 membrane protein [Flavobacterium suncheonense GH29-5 = DSM 17707]